MLGKMTVVYWQCALARALGWDSGDVAPILGLVVCLLCDTGQVTSAPVPQCPHPCDGLAEEESYLAVGDEWLKMLRQDGSCRTVYVAGRLSQI